MKKYLIRAPFDPLTMCFEDPSKWVFKDYTGGNSGNLMFAYGVMNVLKTQNTELSYTYRTKFTDAQAAKINEQYDAFILPLADAFRPQFMQQLTNYTSLIKRLSIPTIVIGVGLRADYEPDLKSGFVFDETAAGFIKAVLDKSSIIGLRGGITADYLRKLGFREEKDYTVIGCPSLYTYGTGLVQRELPDKLMKLAFNTNDYYDIGYINEFICNTVQKFPDCCLIQQIQAEFVDYYVGNRFPFNQKMKNVPPSLLGGKYEELKRQDRVRYFFDTISWINFLRRYDLFVGNRFHGSVAAILSGTPNVMMPFNARTREMTEYHHITSLKPEEIKENTSILDYMDKLDFHAFERTKSRNLKHYMDFLNINGLTDNILLQKTDWNMGDSPLEKEIQHGLHEDISRFCHEVHGINSLSALEKRERLIRCNMEFGIAAAKSIIK